MLLTACELCVLCLVPGVPSLFGSQRRRRSDSFGSADGRERGASASSSMRRQISHSVVQAIAGTIYSHRSTLRRVWQSYDDDLTDVIPESDFKEGLEQVRRSPFYACLALMLALFTRDMMACSHR